MIGCGMKHDNAPFYCTYILNTVTIFTLCYVIVLSFCVHDVCDVYTLESDHQVQRVLAMGCISI